MKHQFSENPNCIILAQISLDNSLFEKRIYKATLKTRKHSMMAGALIDLCLNQSVIKSSNIHTKTQCGHYQKLTGLFDSVAFRDLTQLRFLHNLIDVHNMDTNLPGNKSRQWENLRSAILKLLKGMKRNK